MADFNPDEPRDETGKWTSGGGGKAEEGKKAEEEGKAAPKKRSRRLSDPAQIVKKAKEMGKANWEQLEEARRERESASDALFAAPEGEAKNKAWDNLHAARSNLKTAKTQFDQAGAEFKSMIELPKTERAENEFQFSPHSDSKAVPGEQLKGELSKASEWITSMLHKERVGGTIMQVSENPLREYFSPSEVAINISQHTGSATIVHEVGHRLEYMRSAWLKADNEFLESRTQGETPVSLAKLYANDGYNESETAREDKWVERGGTAYSGKNYSDGETEILSTGLERMYRNPLEFAMNDPEFFTHVFKLIRSAPQYS